MDNYRKTPLALAASNGHRTVMMLFMRLDGVKADSKDGNGKTPSNDPEGVVVIENVEIQSSHAAKSLLK